MDLLTIIVPAYNEQCLIHTTTTVLCSLMNSNYIPFEILYIDDGSTDQTWAEINQEINSNEFVSGIRFSRNFGKDAALFAGLKKAKGACCVTIDCDLQHPPEKIVEMYNLWKSGYDIVEGVKVDRGKESIAHRFAAKLFYRLISAATNMDLHQASDFKLLDRRVVNVLINMPEHDAFFRALTSWVGFNSCKLEYEVKKRTIGYTKWSIFSLFKYAINNLTAFTSIPMHIVTIMGAITLFISFVLGIQTLYHKITGMALEGFSTVILVQLYSSSVVMISIGLLGIYISKIYNEVKNRPRYVIAEYIDRSKRTR